MKNFALLDALLMEVAKGNVTMMGSLDNYVLFKYSTNCHIEDKWNAHNRQARGIIFYAPTANIVCRPFDKFFNLDERTESKLENLPTDEKFVIWEKVDGSCCSAYMHFNEIRCATPGSYESPQAEWATKWLRNHIGQMPQNAQEIFKELLNSSTLIFEGIWSEKDGNPSPGVVNYGNRQELVLLAIRDHNGEEWHPNRVNEIAKLYAFNRPNSIVVDSFDRSLAEKVPDNEEGYVIQYLPSNIRVKVKSPTYMMLHKVRDQISDKGICEIMEAGESRRWLTTLPKHLAERADDIIARLNQRYFAAFYKIEEVCKQAQVYTTRKEQALHIQQALSGDLTAYRGVCFNMLDNKFYNRNLWKVIGSQIKEENKCLGQES